MAVYEVYTQPELRKYKTHIFSKATFFQLICLALTWISPLLIGLSSQGFWQRVDTYIEQPEIHFKHQLMLELQTSTSNNYVSWSTYTNLNRLQMDHLRVPIVKSWEEDSNHDGLMDVLHLQIDMPLTDSEQVYSLKLLLTFDYVLEKFAYIQMECAAFMDYISPIPGASYQITGDLSLVQKQPIGHKGIDSRYNDSIINETSMFAEDFQWSHILSSYAARNLTTVLTSSYPIWVTGRGAGKPFVVNATIRYPIEYRILYYPGFWQLTKFGWVQYLALLIPFWFIFQKIKVFVFSNQLVSTIVERPFKQKVN